MSLPKNLATTLFAILTTLPAVAQVSFDQVRHELGTILWKTPTTATFTVKNNGTQPLIVLDVHPDCGCTVATWTHTPIAPGGTGAIAVTYDAELLGSFEKHIDVRTNAATQPTTLTISGDVARTLADRPKNYTYHIGDIYLESDEVEYDDVRRGQNPVKMLRLYNASKKTLDVQLMHLPKYLTATAEPAQLRPGHSGRINLTLNSDALHNDGLTQTSIYLNRFVGDRASQENEINVSATLLPELKFTEADLAAAPVAQLDSTTIHMPALGTKKRVKAELQLHNTGRSPLRITALQVYNPGISVSIGHRTIEPGKSEKMKITVNATTHGFKGRRRILLITNDPVTPKAVIDVIIKN